MKIYRFREKISRNKDEFILYVFPCFVIEKYYNEYWFSFNWLTLTLNIVIGEK
jgi:hypothetical protein